MIVIDTTDLTRLATTVFPQIARSVPFNITGALNDSLRSLQANVRSDMETQFDRPTPFVKRGILAAFAKVPDLQGEVYAATGTFGGGGSASRVLTPHLAGGGREMRRSERRLGSYWTPGPGMRLDRYGNPRGSEIVQILSAMGALGDQSRTERSRKRRGSRQRQFFRLGNTIWERRGGEMVPVIFLGSQPQYQPRLDWRGLAAKVVPPAFRLSFDARMTRSIESRF